jgi:hypothetical protein
VDIYNGLLLFYQLKEESSLLQRLMMLPYLQDWTNKKEFDIYNAASRIWTNATLTVGRLAIGAASINNLAIFAGGDTTNVVNIYNATSNTWSNTTLSTARTPVGVSVKNLALFYRGWPNGMSNVDIHNSTANS